MLRSAKRFHVARFVSTVLLTLIGVALMSIVSAAEPTVDERQTRTFKASVDGKERGRMVVAFTKRSNGTETVRAEADLYFNFVVYRYKYSSVGTETWKDGRLIKLASESDYNGDKYVLQATATQEALEYEVNGETQKTTTDAWIISHCREPSADKVGRKLTLLDADKGRPRDAKLEKVGIEKLAIVDQQIDATHYRMRGDVEVDVWYDAEGRLVRQDSLESGHRMVLELTKTQR